MDAVAATPDYQFTAIANEDLQGAVEALRAARAVSTGEALISITTALQLLGD